MRAKTIRLAVFRKGRLTMALLTSIAIAEPAMAVEQAKYTVLIEDAPYEVREYAPSVAATVNVEGDRSTSVSTGFRQLADYIFGNNQRKSKIAMTAPVTQRASAIGRGAEITGGESHDWIVLFMMPAGTTIQSLPPANNERIHFEQLPGHRIAAIRFSGFWNDSNFATHEARLREWMSRRRIEAISPPTFAYYDPPWTPWFMRTNEILIDVEAIPP